MKYHSSNIPADFEFHDAILSLDGFADGALTLTAEHLNIHKGTQQNQGDHDLEIDLAMLRFCGFRVNRLRIWWGQTQEKTLEGEDAQNCFLSQLQGGITVFDFGKLENRTYYLDGSGQTSFFQASLSFDAAQAQWDAYRQKAWYEESVVQK